MIFKKAADPSSLTDSATILRQGGIILYPTETVYGIGCSADNATAIERIATVKSSGPEAKFLLLIRGLESEKRLFRQVPSCAKIIAAHFWPGPLTLILPAGKGLHERLIGPSGGIAVRQSSHIWPQRLMNITETALVSTSANFSGDPEPADTNEINKNLIALVDIIIEAGCLSGKVSTVLDICQVPPKLIRESVISAYAISKIIGDIQR